MTCLNEIFQPICQEVQTQVKKYLSGILSAGFIKPYLPQHWVFITESETITFMVEKKGNTSVVDGESETPDVTIKIDHDFLCQALKTRERPDFEPSNYDISFQTKKGETAFNYLRKHLGL